MASPGWRTSVPVDEQARQHAGGFDFYQLVRLLQQVSANGDGEGVPGKPLRFKADYSAAFPGKEISRVRDAAEHTEVTTPNYVLGGYLGPLPEAYSEWLQDRSRVGDHAMADFLDLFNDRINRLRYQIKAQCHQGFVEEAPESSPMASYLSSFLGLGDQAMMDVLPIPKRALLGMAGVLASGRRSLSTLQSILRAFLDAPVWIEECQGAWRQVDEEDRTFLNPNNYPVLGDNACLGSQYWDQQAMINVNIGPVDYQTFKDLLPTGKHHDAFAMLLRWLTNGLVESRVNLSIAARDLEPTELHQSPSCEQADARLGYDSWIGSHDYRGPAPMLTTRFFVKSDQDSRISEGAS